MPQHAITTPMPPCGGLMSAGDGPCSDRGKTDGLLMQQALFSFTVRFVFYLAMLHCVCQSVGCLIGKARGVNDKSK